MFSRNKFTGNGAQAGSFAKAILDAVKQGALTDQQQNGPREFASYNEWSGNDNKCVEMLTQMQLEQQGARGGWGPDVYVQRRPDDRVGYRISALEHNSGINHYQANRIMESVVCPVSNVGMGSVGMGDGMLGANRYENRFRVDAAVALGEGDNNDHGIDMSSELGYPVNI